MPAREYNRAGNALLQAVSWLCRPLIRLLIARNVTYPQLRELLKELYVVVAAQEFGLEGKTPSDSRIYILTGVHRKDIKRLRQAEGRQDEQATQIATLGGAVVGRWLGLPEYQDDNGEPRCLPRSGDNPPGFDQLVASVSKDVRPRAILDEWLRLGIVALNDNGAVCLNRKAFVPTADFAEQTFFLGRNVHDHLAACAYNMQQDGPPMLERSVYYSFLSPKSLQQLREVAQRDGMALLQRLNKQALRLQQQDKGRPDATRRMRYGCYWYEQDTQHDGEETR